MKEGVPVQERLDKQKEEREAKGAEYDKGFKPQVTSEEKGARRKAIVANIGAPAGPLLQCTACKLQSDLLVQS